MYFKTYVKFLCAGVGVWGIGCGPLALDLTASLGANQNIKKTLDINQRQTDAQVEAQSGVVKDVVGVLPLVLRIQPVVVPEEGVGEKRLNVIEQSEVRKECPILEFPPCSSLPKKSSINDKKVHKKAILRSFEKLEKKGPC